MSVPTICAVAIQPSAKPSIDAGTVVETSAVAAPLKPAKSPISTRAPSNSKTLNETPIRIEASEPQTLARTSMTLRPKRSARAPQYGEENANRM